MLELGNYAYYIFRNADQWCRVCFQDGTKETHLEFIEERGIEPLFLGVLRLPLKLDIDTLVGIGNKVYKDTVVVTCRSIGLMMTKRETSKPFLEQQRDFFRNAKRNQEEYIDGQLRKISKQARK